LAEVLLQRTRADLVVPIYDRCVARFPTAEALAAARPDAVADLLRPLGFSHRNARVPALGRALRDDFGGRVPQSYDELRSLPGVGRYVANAVLLLAYGQRRPLLDPNVIRLLERAYGIRSSKVRPREDPALWELVDRIVPGRSPQAVALGLVDLGSLVCLKRRPRCGSCPLHSRCNAFRAGYVVPGRASDAAH
jgi:A/G-specific adenine glycosylase